MGSENRIPLLYGDQGKGQVVLPAEASMTLTMIQHTATIAPGYIAIASTTGTVCRFNMSSTFGTLRRSLMACSSDQRSTPVPLNHQIVTVDWMPPLPATRSLKLGLTLRRPVPYRPQVVRSDLRLHVQRREDFPP